MRKGKTNDKATVSSLVDTLDPREKPTNLERNARGPGRKVALIKKRKSDPPALCQGTEQVGRQKISKRSREREEEAGTCGPNQGELATL